MSANGYASQMNAALGKIQTLTAELAELRKTNENLVLENTSLLLAIEDMGGLRRENARLRASIQGVVDSISKVLGTP
jgi:FtsZ-binding cell division protein ZapB